jgi:hypothetical protein
MADDHCLDALRYSLGKKSFSAEWCDCADCNVQRVALGNRKRVTDLAGPQRTDSQIQSSHSHQDDGW